MHDRRDGHRAGRRRPGSPGFLGGCLARCGECGGGAQFEDLTGRHAQPGRAQTRHQLDGDDRIAAEGEEIVVDPDTVEAEDVGDGGAQRPLGLRARLARTRQGREVRLGQRLPVDLAVGRERKAGKSDEHGGHHVVRQPVGERGPHRGGVGSVTDDVPDEPRGPPVVGVRDHHGVPHGRMRGERGLDLAGFHADPRILTWSSSRPTYSSAPSCVQRTTSPVRYMRVAGPWGSATNRAAVRS